MTLKQEVKEAIKNELSNYTMSELIDTFRLVEEVIRNRVTDEGIYNVIAADMPAHRQIKECGYEVHRLTPSDCGEGLRVSLRRKRERFYGSGYYDTLQFDLKADKILDTKNYAEKAKKVEEEIKRLRAEAISERERQEQLLLAKHQEAARAQVEAEERALLKILQERYPNS